NLAGLPANVKAELEAKDRGFDAMQTLQFARDHWDDTSSDIFPNNCAHFVSQALHAGGLPYKGRSTLDDHGWGQSRAGEWEWNMPDSKWWPEVEGYSHTRSWYNADAQQDFFMNNGGERVGISGARPGDVVYFDYADGPGAHVDGESHHVALVTGVLPDGEILYSQHTPGAQNSSLTGRIPVVEQGEGTRHVVVVRPGRSW
ncbi:amidase domain-containing protein, partial [Mycobacterium sp. NPDC003449]